MTNTNPKLPKPVTVTGSDLPVPIQDDTNVNNQNDDQSTNEELDDLPVPSAVFGDDEEETLAPKTNDDQTAKKETDQGSVSNSSLNNILPSIESASSEPPLANSKPNSITDDQSSDDEIKLPQLPNLSEEDEIKPISPIPSPISQAEPQMQLPPVNPAVINNNSTQSGAAQVDDSMYNLNPISFGSTQTAPIETTNFHIPTEVQALSGNEPVSSNNQAIPTMQSNTPPNQSIDINPPIIPTVGDTNITEEKSQGSSTLGKVLLGIGIFLIGGAIVVGGYFGFNTIKNKNASDTPSVAYQEPTVTQKPAPTVAPEASQSAEPDTEASPKATPKSSAKATPSDDTTKVQILNGSGKKGDALNAKNLIESDEYKISSGNADNFDFLGLTIEYKKDYEVKAQNMAKKLEPDYGKATLEANLKDSNEFDVIITLGSVDSDTAEPTATPKATTD